MGGSGSAAAGAAGAGAGGPSDKPDKTPDSEAAAGSGEKALMLSHTRYDTAHGDIARIASSVSIRDEIPLGSFLVFFLNIVPCAQLDSKTQVSGLSRSEV